MIDAALPTPSPPAAAPLSCAQLREWVRAAQRGARLPCGEGASWALAAGPAVTKLVGELAARGFLTPHRSRDRASRALVHLVMRSARPVLPGEVL